MKYMSASKSDWLAGQYVLIAVSDTGSGMSARSYR